MSKYVPEFAHLRVLRTLTAPLTDTVSLQPHPTIQDALHHMADFSCGDEQNAMDAGYLRVHIKLARMMCKLAKILLLAQPARRAFTARRLISRSA